SAIELVNALSWDGEHWARGEAFITVKALGMKEKESLRKMWFQNGPIFAPRSLKTMPDYTPLVRYVTDMAAKGDPTGMMTGRDAVIAAPFGKGRVVAFGPHPELTPELNHWLLNAIRWTAGGLKQRESEPGKNEEQKMRDATLPTPGNGVSLHKSESAIAITADVVLEGRAPAPPATPPIPSTH
ncbi:hypothetical protein JW926_13925, partial [Candidatus Sumerlaeota bacterium]|nr:hypothetical protein [Candidatus Sumerlaeota bacterium]